VNGCNRCGVDRPHVPRGYYICTACSSTTYVSLAGRVVDAIKVCSKCNVSKTHNLFTRSGSELGAYCMECAYEFGSGEEPVLDWWVDKIAKTYPSLHGWTKAQCKETLMQQDLKCAICRAKFILPRITPQFDHDHSTGLARGFLCRSCNLMLGHVRDEAYILENAILYLKKGANSTP
jgi:hypothetical protein